MKTYNNLAWVCALVSAVALPAQSNTYPFPASGNVGIGTSTPNSRKLNVQNTDPANDVGLEVSQGRTTGSNYGLIATATGSGASQNLGIFTTAGGASANHGLRIYNIPASSSNFAIYSDSAAQSYFQGNLGIGIANPRSRLDLGPSLGAGRGVRIGDYLELNEREAINNSFSIGWNAFIAADDGTYAPAWAAGTGMVMTMSAGGFGDLDFYGKNWAGSYSPQNLTSFTHVMRLSTNGNIGIGTTSPTHKLDVYGATGNTVLGIGDVLGSGSPAVYVYTDAVNGTGWLQTRFSHPLLFGVNDTERMRIATNGNVGIGTTNPTQKLSVNGTVRAHEVIVDTGWSDYVFDESYKLKTLSDTEAFVRSEKHLPGIPSAKEVAEYGISVGEMQAKLLAKIEELTLHVIAQGKDISALKSENQNLRSRVSELETIRQP